MSSLRSLLSAGAVIFAAAFVFQACGKQGEGQRCERANGNEDCESPLECQPRGNAELCCPKQGASISVDECRPTNVPTADTGVLDAVDDTGADDTGVVDTGADDTGAVDSGAEDTGAADTEIDAADAG